MILGQHGPQELDPHHLHLDPGGLDRGTHEAGIEQPAPQEVDLHGGVGLPQGDLERGSAARAGTNQHGQHAVRRRSDEAEREPSRGACRDGCDRGSRTVGRSQRAARLRHERACPPG